MKGWLMATPSIMAKIRDFRFPDAVRRGRLLVSEASAEVGYDVGKILRKIDLGITKSATGKNCYVDLRREDFVFIFDAIFEVANSTHQTVFRLANSGNWIKLNHLRAQKWMATLNRGGFLELAIVSRDNRISDRLSIVLWRPHESGYWVATAGNADVKRSTNLEPYPWKLDVATPTIDVVFTWVNSADADWQMMLQSFRKVSTIDKDRFHQTEELRYSIRSVELYAPWVRNIIVFSNCAPPDWFRESDRVRWVRHDEVIASEYLPVFNSHSIETFLHCIPGISENFIYFNDDFFLCGVVKPADFFTTHGMSVSRLEPYGAVQQLRELAEEGKAEDWQIAAVNGAKMIERDYGYWPTKVHRHAPYALRKSVYADMIERYPEQVAATRSARFRSRNDVSFTSFFYHHFAMAERHAVERNENSMILRTSNYRRFLKLQMWRKMRFFCINDGGGSADDQGYDTFKRTFPPRLYPFKSSAEH